MRYIWLVFGVLLVAMLAVLPRLGRHHPTPPPAGPPVQLAGYAPASGADAARADSIVAFGLAQRGTPYVWAGTSPLTGFDCSGFILYTFAHFGVSIPHSTSLLIGVGRPVARAEAQPGDIVVFSGTDQTSTTPGHAGIVISRRGERPLRFVHASSSRREPFVKVNQVENSDYERRFLQVRRVLGPGTAVAAMPRAKAPAAVPMAPLRPTGPVAALPARVAAVAEKPAPIAPLPNVLPKLPARHLAGAYKAATRKTPARKPAAKPAAPQKATARPAAKAAARSSTKAGSPGRKTAPPKKKRVPTR